MIIILDPGHGIDTPGKRSPDNRLLEYKYCREIVNEIKRKLTNLGYAVQLTVNSDKDVSLSTRCKTVNKYCSMYDYRNSGKGDWGNSADSVERAVSFLTGRINYFIKSAEYGGFFIV